MNHSQSRIGKRRKRPSVVDQLSATPLGDICSAAGPSSFRRGDLVGGYLVDRVLERGAFGSVWKAEDVASGERVAIKVLHPFLCNSAEAVARLRREAEAIAAIRHPNVVEILDFDCLPDGRPYIVMELLEGTSLYTRLRLEGAFSPARSLEVLEGICAALTATHALGIIHRDIKASNAFIASDGEGEGERTVLLDYGLAKILESDGPELTSSRATLGTPSAMSPEQIRSQPVTPRSDVYALGALAYHLLTGEPAFFTASRPTIFYMHLHSNRPRPSNRADVSPAFDDIVARAMARDPDKRYPTAMAFLADFASAVRNDRCEPVVAPESVPVESSARMLGVYLDVDTPDFLAELSDEMLEDIEAIADIAEPILGAANFDLSVRRGNSALFIKVVAKDSERAERRRLLRLLAVIRSAMESRPGRADGVSVRLAVDIVPGGVGDSAAEQALLEAATRVAGAPSETNVTLGTARFFADLGLVTRECRVPDFFCVANNSEL